MTSSAAYEILGLTPKADKKAIKKRYRYLMHQVHPDSGAFKAASGKSYDYRYSAQEINAAYSFLYKNDNFKLQENIKNTGTTKYTEKNTKYSHNNSSDDAASNNSSDFNYSPKNKTIWKAETNPNAYTERNIYHYTEDSDGNVFGAFVIATGKYIWNHNEDFPLFLKSMFDVSKRLLDGVEGTKQHLVSDSVRLKFQADLTYLLSQQFIHFSAALHDLLKPISDEQADIFYIESMLELDPHPPVVRAGMTLYPTYLKNHRLFVKTKSGKEAGYISFKDDRLYYLIIPLLEQKRAQVKIEISKEQDRLNTRGQNKYKNIDFMIKLLPKPDKYFPENINTRIDELLQNFTKI